MPYIPQFICLGLANAFVYTACEYKLDDQTQLYQK